VRSQLFGGSCVLFGKENDPAWPNEPFSYAVRIAVVDHAIVRGNRSQRPLQRNSDKRALEPQRRPREFVVTRRNQYDVRQFALLHGRHKFETRTLGQEQLRPVSAGIVAVRVAGQLRRLLRAHIQAGKDIPVESRLQPRYERHFCPECLAGACGEERRTPGRPPTIG